MKKLILLFLLVISSFAFGAKVGGVEISKTERVNGRSLELNGVGIRKKAILKLYVGSLYTAEKTSNPKSVIEGREEMAIKLDIVSKLITSDAMLEAVEEGFTSSVSKEDMPKLKGRIDEFTSVFRSEIKKGDSFTFKYAPGAGVRGFKNGELLITTKGHDFKEALFAIWLGEKPADKNLKRDMLGL